MLLIRSSTVAPFVYQPVSPRRLVPTEIHRDVLRINQGAITRPIAYPTRLPTLAQRNQYQFIQLPRSGTHARHGLAPY